MKVKKYCFASWICAVCLPLLCAVGMGAQNESNDSWIGSVKDASGKPIAGVPVSDGQTVVKTDVDGRFAIPQNADGRFLFPTVPSGFRSVGPFYQRIVAEKKEYAFVLHEFPQSAGEQVKFIQISDVEIASGQLVWRDNVRDFAKLEGCAFVVSTGDICYRKGLEFNAENVNDATIGVPTYHTVGNHDLLRDDPQGYSEKTYEDRFGPCWYSFNAGPIHFVVTPMPSGDAAPSYSVAKVARWLKQDLAAQPEGTPVVVFNHSALNEPQRGTKEMYLYGLGTDSPVDLRANLKAWLFGHYHTSSFWQDPETKTVFGSAAPGNKGGIDHSVGSFHVYTMNQTGIENIELRPVYVDHQANVLTFQRKPDPDRIQFMAHGYDSAARVKSVDVELFDDQGKSLFSGPLKQVGEWTWSSETPHSVKQPFKGSVKARFQFADGVTKEASESIPTESSHRRLSLGWATNVGGRLLHGAPLILPNGIVVGTADDGNRKNCAIVKLDFEGQILWKTPVESSIRNSVVKGQDNLIYATDSAWNTYALSQETGDIVWKTGFGPQPHGCANAPVVANGIVYAGCGNRLTAFDAKNGTILWQNKENRVSGTAANPVIIGGKLIVPGNWSGLFAHDLTTGKTLWSYKEHPVRFQSSAPIQLSQDEGKELILNSTMNTLSAHDPDTGAQVITSEPTGNLDSNSSPVVVDNLILAGSVNEGLIAFDKKTFKKLWNVKTGPNLIYAPPYSSPVQSTIEATPRNDIRNAVLFGAMDGCFYAVEPTREKGTVLEMYNVGVPILAEAGMRSQSDSGNFQTVYVTDFDGNVYCFLNY